VIRLESGILVLDAPISKEDAEAVGEFAKHVKEQEQERIIKLLQDRIDNHMKAGLPNDGNCACGIYEYTIALIKGEEE
jgi:hypothetical protein